MSVKPSYHWWPHWMVLGLLSLLAYRIQVLSLVVGVILLIDAWLIGKRLA